MRILVVEDEPDIQKLVSYYLASLATCEAALDGQTAVEKFSAALKSGRGFDLVLLDLMLPRLDGHQVLEKIRGLEHAQGRQEADGVKIIIMTARDETRSVVRAFIHHCDSYLVKPFDQETLVEEIRELGLLPKSKV
ncbi:MAG: response regulator transcription factor [candidate division FCPU426 bacterium]